LTDDTSFCPDVAPTFYDPNVNNVTEALRVLDETIGLGAGERHWAYAAFYESEGWTEANATEIKGVRHALAPPLSSACALPTSMRWYFIMYRSNFHRCEAPQSHSAK